MNREALEKQIVRQVEQAVAEMEVALTVTYPKLFDRFPVTSTGDQFPSRKRFLDLREAYVNSLIAQVRWSIWINS